MKITVPPGDWPSIREAMAWEGIDEAAALALSSLRKNVARILRDKKRTLEMEQAQFEERIKGR